ncbi:aldose 1-epimerase family protein [Flavobacterium sp. NG2]|uniref:aldose 1-epimerase family protein n=1 Tax=Flavobacterium sp. NG2 TaxID=3097547 RepID=UPI002A83A2BA|nr:aldose 1-epimerase family protein [Flavobacterium sp. NG2]WPR70844.1 aldose 1-epimerase family protein [Flavobacterium sp. NG2]
MKTTLRNSQLTAQINHLGAELNSLKNNSGKEYIWEGNPDFWGKHSPVLFPIVGTLNNNTFKYEGNTYSLSRHGFAREMEFELVTKTDNSATFSIQSNAETLTKYPLDFEFQIIYTLKENQLDIAYKVINKSLTKLPFSVGAHPAFALPGDFENYSLQFEKEEPLEYHLLENNLISNKKAVLKTANNSIQLNHQLFKDDALIFKSLQSKNITILTNNKPLLKVVFEDFPHLGIWTMINAPFLCIEPWFGYSDTTESNGNLFEKEGIQVLNSKETFNSKFTIEIL